MNCDIGTGHSKSWSMKKSLQEETNVALLQWFSLKQTQGPLVFGPVCLHRKNWKTSSVLPLYGSQIQAILYDTLEIPMPMLMQLIHPTLHIQFQKFGLEENLKQIKFTMLMSLNYTGKATNKNLASETQKFILSLTMPCSHGLWKCSHRFLNGTSSNWKSTEQNTV